MASIPHTPAYGAVYLIANTVSGSVYVGLSTNPRKRWRWHLCELRANRHPNPYLQRAWNKYGAAAFEFSVLEECDTLEALNDAEVFWIGYLRYIGTSIYNQKSGGGFGGEFSQAMRQKLSRSHTGKVYTPETCANISRNTRGVKKTRTPKLEAKWEAQRGRVEDSEQTTRRIAAMMARRPVVVLRSPDGVQHETQNVAAFAREHNLHPRLLGYVTEGKQRSHRGWVLVARKEVPA